MSTGDVHPLLYNIVVGAIWSLLLAPPLAATVALLRFAVWGELVLPDIALTPQSEMLVILGVLGLYGLIGYMAVRETFGGEDVDEGIASATEVVDDVDERVN